MASLHAAQAELAELAERAADRHGRLGVLAEDLGTGERVALAADRTFTSASVIKLPVLVTVLDRVESGAWSLDARLTIRPTDRVGGTGIIAHLADVHELSLRDLLMLMIVLSDNTATNVLIDAVGLDAVNAWCTRTGLTRTVLARRMLDLAARERGAENVTSPADVAALLAALARGELLGEQATGFALDVLTRQQVNDRLPRHLPAGVRLAHKTGELAGIRHDAGLVLPPDRSPLVIVALTEGFTDPHSATDAGGPAADLVAEVGRVVYAASGLTP